MRRPQAYIWQMYIERSWGHLCKEMGSGGPWESGTGRRFTLHPLYLLNLNHMTASPTQKIIKTIWNFNKRKVLTKDISDVGLSWVLYKQVSFLFGLRLYIVGHIPSNIYLRDSDEVQVTFDGQRCSLQCDSQLFQTGNNQIVNNIACHRSVSSPALTLQSSVGVCSSPAQNRYSVNVYKRLSGSENISIEWNWQYSIIWGFRRKPF